MAVNYDPRYLTYDKDEVQRILAKAAESAPQSTTYTKTEVDELVDGKQDAINDLTDIREGATAGSTAYQKPASGIPASDMASAVQTSLGKADAAAPQSTTYTKTEVDNLLQNVDIDVDSALSTTSENPVQNKVVKAALDTKADADSAAFIGNTIATETDVDLTEIDAVPTAGSENAVSSGGVYNALASAGVYGIAAASVDGGDINAAGNLNNISDSGYSHFAFPVSAGDVVKILGSSTNATDYVIAKDYTAGVSTVTKSSSYPSRNRITANSAEVTITIPSDGHWVLVSNEYNGQNKYKPRSMKLNGVDMFVGQVSLPSRVTTLEEQVNALSLSSFVQYIAASNKFEFFSGVNGLYYSFIIEKKVNAEIIQNLWRITGGFKYNGSLTQLHQTIHSGENEFTAKFDGFKAFEGFIGGYHGGELMDGDSDCFVKFFLDGKEVTTTMMQSDFKLNCNEFKYIQYTTLNKVSDSNDEPITGTPAFAHHLKETTIKDGKMSVRNIVVFDSAVTTTQYFSGLFCVAKPAAAYCIVPLLAPYECQGDNGYINATDKDDAHITMWSITNNTRVEVTSKYIRGIDWPNVSQTERVWDRSGDSKYYRYTTSSIAKQQGEIVETEMEVEFT